MRRLRRSGSRLLARRGVDLEGDDADPLAEESLALAGLGQAAVQGRAALGRRAGRGPVRLGADPHAPWVERAGPWRAHDGGFDVHAGVTVAAHDRAGLEQLCCYVFRPPPGQQRLRRLADGRIAVALQRPWADGTTHLVFTPLELLERLAVLIPRPRVNLVLYHGVLAPNAPWRRAVVPPRLADPAPRTSGGRPSGDTDPMGAGAPPDPSGPPASRSRPKYRTWADLMRRTFAARAPSVAAAWSCWRRSRTRV